MGMDKFYKMGKLKHYSGLMSYRLLLLAMGGRTFVLPEKKSLSDSLNAIDTVPFLNKQWEENYFIGNGILGGGGDRKGVWNFLLGPDYTSPNFLASEILSIYLNGELKNLALSMQGH